MRTNPPVLISFIFTMACGSEPSSPAVGSTASAWLLAETPVCRAELTRLSYDDPGGDDAEFVEIRVVRTGEVPVSTPDGGPVSSPPPCDPEGGHAGSPNPEGSAPAPLTLGHCGLERLELVNGSDCGVYREIPLSSVVVPDDDFVVVCSEDAVLTSKCDVTHAGTRKLPNGWLQNGPDDGLRFSSTETTRTLVYEGGADSCFDGAAELVEETGEIVADGVALDDVNVGCAGEFRLENETSSPLRTDPVCAPALTPKRETDAARARPDAATLSPSGGTVSAPTGTGSESVRIDEPPPALLPELASDAGSTEPPSVARPDAPGGCAVARSPHAPPGKVGGGLFAALGLASVRRLDGFVRSRRRVRLPNGRARSGLGRFVRGLLRSP